jgi:hypothetical protein
MISLAALAPRSFGSLVRFRGSTTLCRSLKYAVAGLLLMATLIACGGASASSPASATGASARDASAIDSRVQGSWRLVDYRPELAPDPMFQALLTSQLGVMIVRFEQGRLYADSPTFHTTRAYRIVDAAGPLFAVESPDVGGVVLRTSAAISDDSQRITFQGNTEPWRGSGTLVRVQ